MGDRKKKSPEVEELEVEIGKILQNEKVLEANLNVFKNNLKKTQLSCKEIDGSFRGCNLYKQLGKAFLLSHPQTLKEELRKSILKQESDIKDKEAQKLQLQKRREERYKQLTYKMVSEPH